jgi:membrane dipeptidase
MKNKLLVFFCLMSAHLSAQDFKKIHSSAILIDTHNDILTQTIDYGYVMDQDLKGKTHSDLARWKEGGLDVQVFSVFCDGDKKNPYQYANVQMDSLDAVLKRNMGKIVKAGNSKELMKIVSQNKIAAMFGVEGGHMIENDINNIDSIYARGVRYMTITWNNSTDWATSAFDETFSDSLPFSGLTEFGKEVIQHMNKLGMLVDVSHVGEQTFWDIMQITNKPVIASHSSVRALCNHQRNLNDNQIRAIARNAGVIQINFYSGFLENSYMKKKDAFLERHAMEGDSLTTIGMAPDRRETFLFEKYAQEMDSLRAPFSSVIEHIDYIVKLVGVNFVGIGSDFDGIESPPKGLDDVTKYPLITEALLNKGYSEEEINKILGGNFLRVLKANEK